MSDTPRTDKAEYEVRLGRHRRMVVRPKLCRELERELSALRAAAARVEWKFGRNDDGTRKDWQEWQDLRAALGWHVRQPQELEQ